MESKSGAFKRALKELLDDSLIEYTIPDKPNSRLQKYRVTEQGRKILSASPNEDPHRQAKRNRGNPNDINPIIRFGEQQ